MTKTTYDHVDAALGLVEASQAQAIGATDPGLMAQAQVAATVALAHSVLAVVDRLDELIVQHAQEVMAYQAQQGECQHPAASIMVGHDIEGGRVVKHRRCGACGETLEEAPGT